MMGVFAAIAARRDVRNEFSGEMIDDQTLTRLLGAAHSAPSVGNTQPWDFVVVQDPATLEAFADHVERCRTDFADSLPPERREKFEPINVQGIESSGTGVVVTYDPTRGGPNILGRHTVDETGHLSVALAIQNLWLAATSERIGVGWVSFYHEDAVKELVGLPAHMHVVAWLCVGPVTEFQRVPDLERFGWRDRRPLADAVHRERYRASEQPN